MSHGTTEGIDYIKAFSQAAEIVLQEVLNEPPTRGEAAYVTEVAITLPEINVGIGLTGDIQGQVNFGMSANTAKAIAATMMFEDVPELDEMAISALCELANMISGNARTFLNRSGIVSDITPPSITTGDNLSVSWIGMKTMTLEMGVSSGRIQVTVGIRNKGESE